MKQKLARESKLENLSSTCLPDKYFGRIEQDIRLRETYCPCKETDKHLKAIPAALRAVQGNSHLEGPPSRQWAMASKVKW
jgi:hypothetical protein